MWDKLKKLWSGENLWALLIALVLILLIILSSNDAPLWIYQGF
jgi:hypothetical protein